jgi:hypothetical protein
VSVFVFRRAGRETNEYLSCSDLSLVAARAATSLTNVFFLMHVNGGARIFDCAHRELRSRSTDARCQIPAGVSSPGALRLPDVIPAELTTRKKRQVHELLPPYLSEIAGSNFPHCQYLQLSGIRPHADRVSV